VIARKKSAQMVAGLAAKEACSWQQAFKPQVTSHCTCKQQAATVTALTVTRL